jgi:hypothetical protein
MLRAAAESAVGADRPTGDTDTLWLSTEKKHRYDYGAQIRLRVSHTSVATKAIPCASFRADTLVLMADGSKKPIGDVEVGDQVVARDPVTGKTSIRVVTKLFMHIDDDLPDLVVLTDDGVETIHTTDHHRFWNDSAKVWVEAKDLRGGVLLLTTDGALVTVGSLKQVPGAAPMLDLAVEYDHTFYVALKSTSVLVHNQNCDLLGAHGTQTTSETLLKQRGRDFRIDVGNPAPGVSAGHLHLQDSAGGKYIDDFATGGFVGMPASLAKKVAADSGVAAAIRKGKAVLGVGQTCPTCTP